MRWLGVVVVALAACGGKAAADQRTTDAGDGGGSLDAKHPPVSPDGGKGAETSAGVDGADDCPIVTCQDQVDVVGGEPCGSFPVFRTTERFTFGSIPTPCATLDCGDCSDPTEVCGGPPYLDSTAPVIYVDAGLRGGCGPPCARFGSGVFVCRSGAKPSGPSCEPCDTDACAAGVISGVLSFDRDEMEAWVCATEDAGTVDAGAGDSCTTRFAGITSQVCDESPTVCEMSGISSIDSCNVVCTSVGMRCEEAGHGPADCEPTSPSVCEVQAPGDSLTCRCVLPQQDAGAPSRDAGNRG